MNMTVPSISVVLRLRDYAGLHIVTSSWDTVEENKESTSHQIYLTLLRK